MIESIITQEMLYQHRYFGHRIRMFILIQRSRCWTRWSTVPGPSQSMPLALVGSVFLHRCCVNGCSRLCNRTQVLYLQVKALCMWTLIPLHYFAPWYLLLAFIAEHRERRRQRLVDKLLNRFFGIKQTQFPTSKLCRDGRGLLKLFLHNGWPHCHVPVSYNCMQTLPDALVLVGARGVQWTTLYRNSIGSCPHVCLPQEMVGPRCHKCSNN